MKHEGMPTQRRKEKRVEECASLRERESPLAPLFICFSLPLGLPHANWASQECYLFYLKSSLRSSDLPLTFLGSSFDLPWFYFRGLFPSLSFSHRHSGLLFPILTTEQCLIKNKYSIHVASDVWEALQMWCVCA